MESEVSPGPPCGAVVVELDGQESHKTKEQRAKDARRDRWFMARGIRVLRWTGSEVHRDADAIAPQVVV